MTNFTFWLPFFHRFLFLKGGRYLLRKKIEQIETFWEAKKWYGRQVSQKSPHCFALFRTTVQFVPYFVAKRPRIHMYMFYQGDEQQSQGPLKKIVIQNGICHFYCFALYLFHFVLVLFFFGHKWILKVKDIWNTFEVLCFWRFKSNTSIFLEKCYPKFFWIPQTQLPFALPEAYLQAMGWLPVRKLSQNFITFLTHKDFQLWRCCVSECIFVDKFWHDRWCCVVEPPSPFSFGWPEVVGLSKMLCIYSRLLCASAAMLDNIVSFGC